jgi:hypothetical protein
LNWRFWEESNENNLLVNVANTFNESLKLLKDYDKKNNELSQKLEKYSNKEVK